MRDHEVKEVETDFVPIRAEIRAKIPTDGAIEVTMHDGSVVRFRSVPEGYDPHDRSKVEEYIRDREGRGEIVTGLLYVDESAKELHEMNATPTRALAKVPYSALCPGTAELASMQQDFR
jgi:2-oxoglutarate ferredoxin oxidoreductase subunit beta